jgi:peptide/nickel transport system permease protein
MRRHVGRPTVGATVAFAPVTLPLFLTNVILVERVFSVPGFFHQLWAAVGHNKESAIDLPIIITAALWTTVLLIILGLISDVILEQIDPRVRTSAG